MNSTTDQAAVTTQKRTVVLGASPNSWRYAYRAVSQLKEKGIESIPIGIKSGDIEGVPILTGHPALENVDTVTLYLNPENQKEYYDYILSLKPKRIIFNPGTYNPELMRLAGENGIETEVGCTLVMLAVGTY